MESKHYNISEIESFFKEKIIQEYKTKYPSSPDKDLEGIEVKISLFKHPFIRNDIIASPDKEVEEYFNTHDRMEEMTKRGILEKYLICMRPHSVSTGKLPAAIAHYYAKEGSYLHSLKQLLPAHSKNTPISILIGVPTYHNGLKVPSTKELFKAEKQVRDSLSHYYRSVDDDELITVHHHQELYEVIRDILIATVLNCAAKQLTNPALLLRHWVDLNDADYAINRLRNLFSIPSYRKHHENIPSETYPLSFYLDSRTKLRLFYRWRHQEREIIVSTLAEILNEPDKLLPMVYDRATTDLKDKNLYLDILSVETIEQEPSIEESDGVYYIRIPKDSLLKIEYY